MTGRAGQRSRQQIAQRLRAALEQLESGSVTVRGADHSIEQAQRRIERRIRELEEGSRR